MAVEYGAHLVSPVLSSPSIFEVLAQENLHGALRPAFVYILKVLANKYPECAKYFKNPNEIYLVLDLIIQNHFLKYYGSSFSENFYGLKRIPTGNDTKTNSKLPQNVHRKSLFFLVIFPYIKSIISRKFELEREFEADGLRDKNEKFRKFRQFFLFVYPWLHLTLETTILLYQLAFTFGRIRVHSPFMYLCGSRLTTLSADDVGIGSQSFVFPDFGALGFRKIVAGLTHNVAVGITWSLSVGAFFVQFLEWWNASTANRLVRGSQYVPPAPKVRCVVVEIE